MKNRSETIARRNSRKLRVRGLHKKVAKAEERLKLVSESDPPIGLVTKLVNKIPHDTEEVVSESVEGLVIPFDTADDDEVASPPPSLTPPPVPDIDPKDPALEL